MTNLNENLGLKRFLVSDEFGPLRAFYTRQEALFFMQEGFTLTVLPKPSKRNVLESLGDAPF